MLSCEWFKMMWTPNNLTWKLNFANQVPKLTYAYGNLKWMNLKLCEFIAMYREKMKQIYLIHEVLIDGHLI